LFDLYEGNLPPKDGQVISAIQELNDRMDAIEASMEKPSEENTITMGDGQRIEKKR